MIIMIMGGLLLMMQKSDLSTEVKDVLNDFVRHAKDVMKDDLISVILFGSAAKRNSFKKGKSDIDLIIVGKEKNNYQRLLDNRLRMLDSKYALGLFHEKSEGLEYKLWSFLKSLGLRENVFLFKKTEFERKKFKPFCKSQILSALLIPKGIIWNDIRKYGVVLYGRNLLDYESRIKITDKIKAPLPGLCCALTAFLLYFFNKEKASILSRNAIKWSYLNLFQELRRTSQESLWKNLAETIKLILKYLFRIK